nr:helix-turn-helix domain-containing protein [Flavobacterium sp. NKUCC04_CG]
MNTKVVSVFCYFFLPLAAVYLQQCEWVGSRIIPYQSFFSIGFDDFKLLGKQGAKQAHAYIAKPGDIQVKQQAIVVNYFGLYGQNSEINRFLLTAVSIKSKLQFTCEKTTKNHIGESLLEPLLSSLKRLSYLNHIWNANYKTLNDGQIKACEKQELIAERDHLIATIDSIKQQCRLVGFVTISLIFGLLYIGWSYKKRSEKQKTSLLNRGDAKSKSTVISVPGKTVDLRESTYEIRADIISTILLQLEKFEREQGFLDPLLTLSSLAIKLETNTAYLSHIVNKHQGKKFATYINELRIDFIYERMLKEQNLLKFSIEGLAQECGFKTAQNFSDAFYQFKGERPSVFIRKLQQKRSS